MADDILAVFRSAPGPRPDGAELSLSRRLRHPPEKVWAALTLPARLEAWMGVEWLGGEAPLTVGGRFTYRFANTNMENVGRVLRLEPPRLLEHTWFENVTPGTVIAWALEADGSGTRLTLTQRFGVADDAARNAAGWTEILRGLDHHLDGGAMADWSPGDWRALRDGYAAELREEATRDGGLSEVERSACPTCGSCSGMFTANSMNCLTEALGLSLPGNGTTLATHADREQLFLTAGRTIVVSSAFAKFVTGLLIVISSPRAVLESAMAASERRASAARFFCWSAYTR